MNTFTFHAVKTFNNGLSRSKEITIKYDGKRSDAILSVLQQRVDLQDCYLIDGDTKCNITLDLTVKMQIVEGKPFNSDRSAYTFNELEKLSDELNKDKNVLSVLVQPFTRFHYSKSGRAIDYLSLHTDITNVHTREPHDGGLWYDSAYLRDALKGSFIRNEFNEVIYHG